MRTGNARGLREVVWVLNMNYTLLAKLQTCAVALNRQAADDTPLEEDAEEPPGAKPDAD